MERSKGAGESGGRGEMELRGRPGASQRGLGRSRLPSQLRSGHASPAPQPPPGTPPPGSSGRGGGEYPPLGTFGTRVSGLPARSQNPGVHPHPVPSPPPASPTGRARGRGVRRTRSTALLSRACQSNARVSALREP